MKKIIVYLTIFSLLNLVGCYTNTRILKEEYSNKMANLDEELQIRLRDGRTIISKAYEHIEVKEPSEFIVGNANIINGRSLQTDINTLLIKTQIDSIDKKKYADNSLVCWSNGNRYNFNGQEYFYITYDSIPGFYVRGNIAETDSNFYGLLEPGAINSIEVIEIDPVNTSLFVAGVVIVSLFIIGAIVFAIDPPLEDDIDLNF